MPLVSVIIPVYNVEKYLRECLDSLINQTLKDIEIICVDDGSTDSSLDILNEYKAKDNRFIILTQKNLNAGVARNNGLKVATGEYLSFLDSDDIFELNMLEEMYNTAKKDNSDTVVCNFYIYDNATKKSSWNLKIDDKFIKKSPFSPVDIKDEIFNFSSPNAWTKLFKHSLFKDNKLQFVDTICCNDFTCVYTALAVSKKISVINKPFIHYRFIQKSNLTARRVKYPDSFLVAAQQLENNLRRFKVYHTFEKSFISRMKSSYNWEVSECTKMQKFEREKLARKILSANLFKILFNKSKHNLYGY